MAKTKIKVNLGFSKIECGLEFREKTKPKTKLKKKGLKT